MSSGVRFAPSPTGRFHIGNLRTAWVAQWWARQLGEPLIIRSEDIDFPRNLEGAHKGQLEDLATLGMIPDSVTIQSSRRARHWELFLRALSDGAIYPCTCSRKEVQTALAGLASAPQGAHLPSGPIYNGHCRHTPSENKSPAEQSGVAWRFRHPNVRGIYDFIIARTQNFLVDEPSFIPSYHWACAIDDIDGKYKLLVRAWDLETSAETQRLIQAWVDTSYRAFPAIYHTALVTQDDGRRLEKRTKGATLSEIEDLGVGTNSILDCFSKSFHALQNEYTPGRIWGELGRSLTLSDLGLPLVFRL